MKQLHIKLTQHDDTNTVITLHFNGYQIESTIASDTMQLAMDELTWYYEDYLAKPFGTHYKKAQHIQQRLQDTGIALAKKLFDDEKLTASVQQDEAIEVIVEGADALTYAFIWDYIGLPSKKMPLLANCNRFIRATNYNHCVDESSDQKQNDSWRVILLCPRPLAFKENTYGIYPSVIEGYLTQIEADICLERCANDTFDAFKTLCETENASHHHSCILSTYIKLTAENSVSLVFIDHETGKECFIIDETVIACILKSKIDSLFIDLIQLDSEYDHLGHIGTRIFIEKCLQAGINNVVVNQFNHYHAYAHRFYSVFLSSIADGRTIAESFTYAKRSMYANRAQSVLTLEPIEYDDWSIIQHYCNKDYALFANKKSIKNPEDQSEIQHVLSRCSGFPDNVSPTSQLGRQHEYALLKFQLSRGKNVCIKGSTGLGVTQHMAYSAFWLVNNNHFDIAVYFNFNDHTYNPESIKNIVEDVIQINNKKRISYSDYVEHNKILFVFDKLDTIPDELMSSINTFIQQQSCSHCQFILNYERDVQSFAALTESEILTLQGLTYKDSRQLACHLLKKYQIIDIEQDPDYAQFIELLAGHPLLMQLFISRLVDEDITKVQITLKEALTLQSNSQNRDVMFCLFENGWAKCSNALQKLIKILPYFPEFISDGFLLQTNKGILKEKCDHLYTLINIDGHETLDAALKRSCEMTIMRRHELGYIRQPYFKQLLDSKTPADDEQSQNNDVENTIAEMIIHELYILYAFMRTQNNKSLGKIIIKNNHYYLNLIAKLWLVDKDLFFKGYQHLSDLFSMLGLQAISANWLWGLVKNELECDIWPNIDDNYSLNYCHVACHIFSLPDLLSEPNIVRCINYWLEHAITIEKPVFFDGIMMMLECYFKTQSDWKQRKTLSQIALEYYSKHDDLIKKYTALLSLARCEEALQNIQAAHKQEQTILRSLQTESVEHTIKTDIILSIVHNQVRRSEYDKAEQLLKTIDYSDINDQQQFTLDKINAEILFEKELYEDATVAYAKLWKKVMRQHKLAHPKQIDQIGERISKLTTLLSEEKVKSIFEAHAPGVNMPSEMAATLKEQLKQTTVRNA